MKNSIYITTDGINAYATIDVKASLIGIRILSCFIILELFLIIWGLTQIEKIGFLDMFVPLIFVLILFVGLPIKYLLWNKYGKEEIIINSKSVSWSNDYGFFKTNLETVKFDRLGTGYEIVKGENENELGRLIFYNYRNEDNLAQIIHQTTVLLKKEEIRIFDNEISKLFKTDLLSNFGFIPFSEN